mmetsp:Transcript_34229/g.80637  ORF Transcript_34229/g.80637 Transcript_34229/m.80637 type:complete len:212 (-) Transcript_34229:143-778(-)
MPSHHDAVCQRRNRSHAASDRSRNRGTVVIVLQQMGPVFRALPQADGKPGDKDREGCCKHPVLESVHEALSHRYAAGGGIAIVGVGLCRRSAAAARGIRARGRAKVRVVALAVVAFHRAKLCTVVVAALLALVQEGTVEEVNLSVGAAIAVANHHEQETKDIPGFPSLLIVYIECRELVVHTVLSQCSLRIERWFSGCGGSQKAGKHEERG